MISCVFRSQFSCITSLFITLAIGSHSKADTVVALPFDKEPGPRQLTLEEWKASGEQPTLLSIDFSKQNPKQVLEQLQQQGRIKFTNIPALKPVAWTDMPPSPAPFWAATRRVLDQSRLLVFKTPEMAATEWRLLLRYHLRQPGIGVTVLSPAIWTDEEMFSLALFNVSRTQARTMVVSTPTIPTHRETPNSWQTGGISDTVTLSLSLLLDPNLALAGSPRLSARSITNQFGTNFKVSGTSEDIEQNKWGTLGNLLLVPPLDAEAKLKVYLPASPPTSFTLDGTAKLPITLKHKTWAIPAPASAQAAIYTWQGRQFTFQKLVLTQASSTTSNWELSVQLPPEDDDDKHLRREQQKLPDIVLVDARGNSYQPVHRFPGNGQMKDTTILTYQTPASTPVAHLEWRLKAEFAYVHIPFQLKDIPLPPLEATNTAPPPAQTGTD